MLRITNKLVRDMPDHGRNLLEATLIALPIELRAWYDLLIQKEDPAQWQKDQGDPWWTKGLEILHLFEVFDDLLEVALDPVDSETLPDDWSEVQMINVDHGLRVDPQIIVRHIERRAGDAPDLKRELTWAFDDFQEGIDLVFGTLLPGLSREGSAHIRLDRRDDCVIMEMSMEVQHLIYHLSDDILDVEGKQKLIKGASPTA